MTLPWLGEGRREGSRKGKGSDDIHEDDLPMINSAHGSNGARHLLRDNYKARKKTRRPRKAEPNGRLRRGLRSAGGQNRGRRQTRRPTLILGGWLGQEKPIYMVTFS